MSKVRFHTFGCKVNQYETQLMREIFASAGIKEDNAKNSDYIVVNGCSVTARAQRNSIMSVKKTLKTNPNATIIAAGCFVEFDSNSINALSKDIILLKNNQKKHVLSKIGIKDKVSLATITKFAGHSRAFVKVQDGCNNFCSYCIVPFLRGRSRSKRVSCVLKEIKGLVVNGYKEIVLTGVCLGDYGKDLKEKRDLAYLLRKILEIKGEFRIRLSSIEPNDINMEIIDIVKNSARICRHLHIPLQSGDDKVLSLMNRHYTVKDYLFKVDKIRTKIPDIAISTDIIVGFPHEDKKSFLNSVKFIRQLKPMRMHVFPYSKRPRTRAGQIYDGSLKTEEVNERKQILLQIASDCAIKYRKSFLNKKLEVLVESRNDKGYFLGYTDNYIYTGFKSDVSLEMIIQSVVIKDVTSKFTLSKIID
ncbi:MAG: tRNA (N(6)-L-threonylcarbamoyladenosine(37)-C(2))-methylthiotransferase MtaB [Candidatus Gygaella obscura]|nr:tRNA (N(6)-L-threonylcarbamoyladenosine(37)-C(2))-methylthiotransferase MtaB [Candidatus Gygaella obscura]